MKNKLWGRTFGQFVFCFAIMCAAGTLLTACSSDQIQKAGDIDQAETIQDPMEGFNRAVFGFNNAIDQALLEPVARGYRALVPQPARTGVRNALRNLRSPINVANQALQGDIGGVGQDVARFTINTVIGLGGLIDVAKSMGLPYEQEDFGQTLGVWGVDHGAYMVLPLVGPSSVRDTAGMMVDTYADPLRIYLYNTHNEEWYYARVAITAIDKREELLDALDDLRKNSFDYYAAVRSAYYQQRQSAVEDRDSGTGSATIAIPDYDSGQ